MKTVELPEIGFLKLGAVLRLIPLGKTAWYDGIREGRFPKPVKLGKRAVAWKVEDVRALINRLGSPENLQSDNVA